MEVEIDRGHVGLRQAEPRRERQDGLPEPPREDADPDPVLAEGPDRFPRALHGGRDVPARQRLDRRAVRADQRQARPVDLLEGNFSPHGGLGQGGDLPATADGEFEIFQNMTAADVQRVAQKYFTPENRIVITLMPKGAGSGRELPQ